MKKKIAREVLYIVSFALIVGLFSVCIVLYNKVNRNKLNKIPPELQNNFSFLQEKNIQFICFNNGKFDYTIPIDMLGGFTSDRSDLKLVGKIINVDPFAEFGGQILHVSTWSEVDAKKDEFGIPIKEDRKSSNTSKETNLPTFDEVMKQQGNSKSIEKLSVEDSAHINAYIANTKLYKKYSNRILTEKDIYYNIKIVALILLTVLFVTRYLYYTVSWSLKTLKE